MDKLRFALLFALLISLAALPALAEEAAPPLAMDPRCAARPIAPYGPPGGRTYLSYPASDFGLVACQVSWTDAAGRTYSVVAGDAPPAGYDFAILFGKSVWVDEIEGGSAITAAWVYLREPERVYLPAVAAR